MNQLLSKYEFKSDLILKDLSPKEEEVVESYMESVSFKKGKMLFYEDGVPTGVFLLKSGKAKIYKTGTDGKEQIFYIYKAGELLGYHALLCNERYEDSCESLEECETRFISKANFNKLLTEIPSLKEELIKNMSHEFGVMVNKIALLAQKSLRERFAIYLLILDYRFGNEGINLSRMDFANLIGSTRESLGKMIKEFREENLIVVEGRHIKIVDSQDIYKVYTRYQ